MHLIQFLLPLNDNDRHPFPRKMYDTVRQEMTEAFGGVTAYVRGPGEGLWEKDQSIEGDVVVLFEVMADELDRQWWTGYRKELEKRFQQEEVIVRATEFEKL